MDIITDLGGPSAVARLVGCRPSSVVEWRARGIPPDRCTVIEQLTAGRFICEQLRPELKWVRIPDGDWPWHPGGRPLLDVAKRAEVAQAA